tara:strand:+ start:10217 stop:11008 length:792 start_codon:yes stop_codon:yes gene_type:complete
MPRDSSGNYTPDASNPVTAGTTIETSWANPTVADFSQAVTDSLDRNGRGGMLVPFKNLDGTVSAPGMTWNSETSLGIYRAGTQDMRVSVGGADVMRWIAGKIQAWDGAAWQDVNNAGDGFAPLASPEFTGTPKAPTPAPANNSTELATTEFVKSVLPVLPDLPEPRRGVVNTAANTITGDKGIASVSNGGTGIITINLTNAVSSTNEAVVTLGVVLAVIPAIVTYTWVTTSQLQIATYGQNGTTKDFDLLGGVASFNITEGGA